MLGKVMCMSLINSPKSTYYLTDYTHVIFLYIYGSQLYISLSIHSYLCLYLYYPWGELFHFLVYLFV